MNKVIPMNTPPKTLCILRLSAIGDVCHMVSVVQRIQKGWPKTQITWVIGKLEASLLKDLPGVEFIVFDKKGGLASYYQLFKQMRTRNFDVLMHAQVAFRASLASVMIPARIRLGFDRKRANDLQWLFTNQKIPYTPKQHVLEGFHSFADHLGVPKTKLEWQIPINETDMKWAEQHVKPASKTLIITPAASAPYRNWSIENYAFIANYAIQKHNMEVILCGGPTALEKQLGEQIIHLCPNIKHNLIGKTTLKQMLALLKHATVLLAPDTGPAHMATMVNTPVIGLYANSNPLRTGPYLSQPYVANQYAETMLKCYGKSIDELPWGKRSYDASNMLLISQNEVISLLDKVLNLNSVAETTISI